MYTPSKHASINGAIPMMSSCHMSHSITLRCLKQVLIPIMQILKCRALEHKVLLISDRQIPESFASHNPLPAVALSHSCHVP